LVVAWACSQAKASFQPPFVVLQGLMENNQLKALNRGEGTIAIHPFNGGKAKSEPEIVNEKLNNIFR
jgi:hypothetical protein